MKIEEEIMECLAEFDENEYCSAEVLYSNAKRIKLAIINNVSDVQFRNEVLSLANVIYNEKLEGLK